jgi:twitching motility protein PilT
MDISELLAFSVKNKASDLHLSAGLPPMIRVHGDVRRINLPPLEHKDVHSMIYDIMNDGQRKAYEENLEIDFSFAIPGLARFRVNAYNQDRGADEVLGGEREHKAQLPLPPLLTTCRGQHSPGSTEPAPGPR